MRLRISVLIIPAIIATAAVVAAAMEIAQVPAGPFPWRLHARDGDPELTRAAREMLPIAAAVDAFLAAQGRCPTWRSPADIDAVLALVPAEMRGAATPIGLRGPSFATSPTAPGACQVVFRLTHDEELVRESDGRVVRWFYEPGDGNDPVPVRLTP
jgi:hypothetical protein